MRRLAVFLPLAAATTFAIASPPTTELVCAELPAEPDRLRLSNDFAGSIKRDASGKVSASVWSRHNHDLGEAVAHLEGDVLRFVVAARRQADAASPCGDGRTRLARASMKSAPEAKLPALQAESLEAAPDLPLPARVEIGSAYDCGGDLYKEYRGAELAGQLLRTQILDDRTLLLTLHEEYSGSEWLTPTFAMTGNKIVVGYTTKSIAGPACMFHLRVSYRVSGIDANKLSVALNGPFGMRQLRRVPGWMLLAAGTCVILLLVILVNRQRRAARAQCDASASASAPVDGSTNH